MDQGKYHDCQMVGHGPEAAESGKMWTECKNHPGHENFIPVSDFCIEHLPRQCRMPSILEMVKIVARSTVKLFVRRASPEREEGYCFSQCSPSSGHVGSGWIVDVKKGIGSCFCEECPDSSSHCEKWYEIFVVTASHVVYNSTEARCTRVDIFFDDEESRKDGRMRSVRGIMTYEEESYQDYSIVSCSTHDQSLAQQLMGHAEQKHDMLVNEKPEDHCNSESEQQLAGDEDFCIMVSHPHGRPKMVTVGVRRKDKNVFWETRKVILTELKRRTNLNTPILYTTETCPGSSGAPVFMPFCKETRRKHSNVASPVAALVIRAHSIGGVLKGVGLSAGRGPLIILPPAALPSPL